MSVVTINTSDEAFITALRDIASQHAHRVYRPCPTLNSSSDSEWGTSCAYVNRELDGTLTPGCLIGQVLIHMGVPLEWFLQGDRNVSGSTSVLNLLGFSRRVQAGARAAQIAQDNGRSWSYAGNEFDVAYREYVAY